MKKCWCGTEMFPDSYEPPHKPVEWLWRCRVCGSYEETTYEEAMIAFDTMKKRQDDSRKPKS